MTIPTTALAMAPTTVLAMTITPAMAMTTTAIPMTVSTKGTNCEKRKEENKIEYFKNFN